KYFREKAAICQRLADGLALNNPGRFQLMDIAEDLQELAKALEVYAPTNHRSQPWQGESVCGSQRRFQDADNTGHGPDRNTVAQVHAEGLTDKSRQRASRCKRRSG